MLVVQFAVYLAVEPAGDVESRLVDLLLARPLPRHYLLTRSLVVMTGAALVLPLSHGTQPVRESSPPRTRRRRVAVCAGRARC